MSVRRRLVPSSAVVTIALASVAAAGCTDPVQPNADAAAPQFAKVDKEALVRRQVGQRIYFDRNLSLNRNQACVSCHSPEWGWTAPDPDFTSPNGPSQGSIAGQFGGRRAMSAAYASPAPPLHTHDGPGPNPVNFRGGNFWDGRATGLGPSELSPVAEQSQKPFTNVKEMALRDEACVVYRVSVSTYAERYVRAFGEGITMIRWPEVVCSVQTTRRWVPSQASAG